MKRLLTKYNWFIGVVLLTSLGFILQAQRQPKVERIHLRYSVSDGNPTAYPRAPSLSEMQPIFIKEGPRKLEPMVSGDLLVEAIIQIETQGNPLQIGSAGERGLMQIMPDTWEETTREMYGYALDFDHAFDPEINKRVGRAYLEKISQFLTEHQAHWNADMRSLLLACYNYGMTNVKNRRFDLDNMPYAVWDYATRGSALHHALLQEEQERFDFRVKPQFTSTSWAKVE